MIRTHPPIIVTPFGTHDEVREADGYRFSSATLSLVMGDHAGTHVDAPDAFRRRPGAKSIDEMPLENFFTEAVCLDLSHKPLKSDISIEDLQKAEQAAGVTIKPKDTVLLHMDFYRRMLRHAGLHHRLPRPDQGVGDLARPARASACSASRR